MPRGRIEDLWRAAEPSGLSARRGPDGSAVAGVERNDALGYRMAPRGFGALLVSSDGSVIRHDDDPTLGWRGHRLVLGRALPIAAVLQGIEAFHASAVGLEGRAVAFIGPSGAGKTSLVVALALRGGSFVTDDVLALESHGDELRAHPGAAVASIRRADEEHMPEAERKRLGHVIERGDKVHYSVRREEASLPLELMYFVARGGARTAFEEISPPDPRLLLASTFVFEVRTPERMVNQLDLCARLARRARMFRLVIPESLPASAAAEPIEAHARSMLAAGVGAATRGAGA